LPTNAAARARATAWLIAALNSVEPFVMQLSTIEVFSSGEDWAKQRRPAVVEMIDKRLSRLATALGEKPYLDGDTFTAGDLMMASALRSLEGKNMLERYPDLIAYLARCLGRQGLGH
jgi:glutathione S-transferase